MEKFGTRKKTRDRFLVSGLFIEGSHAPRMSHLSRGKAASSFSDCDIGMDASDWEEINLCDVGRCAAESGNTVKNRALFLL
ncbi:hypothetical protein [Rhizobium herbae]|uniref:Uncharacterized protein n=1 Tax=Rhizobium herbae TaxID=508661 RepID=A0ABS4EH85_9HYPH|nr:hypothetical protein [Rhizobium herbae]MBP1857311.1 hypothetical protein [Rhizobium herbae]